ncbi:interleukin-12 subunit beta [Bufo gargarizans]|uniref:interleukin-12 subunit beta n=1 Tax=Bufo gargarizans TaxID=30331 RepID=UPI001CF14C73|nr:interleukin-12 subunit beta [Bufo gargarizans]
MGHLLAAVILLVCTDLLQASKPFHLKEKTLIVEVDYTNRKTGEIVTIECNTTAYTNAAIDSKKIQWSKKGHRGKTLTVQVSESPDAKNYTCTLENIGIIDYTHIVLHNVNQPFYRGILNVENPISCMMKNYSGHFTCSWSGTKDYSNPEFFFEAFSNNSSLPCERIEKHITEGNAIPSYTVNCHDTQTCHYSEDPSIFVELHVLAKNRYEQHKKSFTLRNIIKPDPPQDLHIHKAAKNLSLQWEYPKTWCSSHLFYQLMFNVKVERKNSKKDVNYPNVDKTYMSVDHMDISQFCVQARDMYHINSYWSNWSCSK